MSDDIAYRQRRYLIMMGVRVLCFIVAVILFANHGGWLTAIPIVGAITIPYFAVVFANGGREPTGTRGFRPYEPNLPAPYAPPEQPNASPAPGTSDQRSASAGTSEPSAGPAGGRETDPGTPGASGAPPHNA
jgi:Protein of unknown function (DUF3099)